MQNILVTGAAGDIGTRLRKLLKGAYPRIRWSDIRTPANLGADEEFVAADLGDYKQVEKVVAGIDGIAHFGGYSVEGDWPTILSANIVGRSEEHTSELQSPYVISYAVFCLKTKSIASCWVWGAMAAGSAARITTARSQ